ncbi:MAG: zinc ribbon domain-containing protein [Candidatus Methanoplasma sp.]|jgi:lipopolysaccharide export LptBFGC system permease protein LptF|nr:zinc ribbon domain-containing protein [Candidatus Methanoplasma sp.]
MNGRRCPNCGEHVDNNSLTCPKCFKEIPRDVPVSSEPRARGTDAKNGRNTNKNLAVILALIPAFFGLLGLGQIYRDPTKSKGYILLVIGAVIFVPFVLLFLTMMHSGFLSALLIFIMELVLFLIYVGVALYALVDIALGSMLKMFRI